MKVDRKTIFLYYETFIGNSFGNIFFWTMKFHHCWFIWGNVARNKFAIYINLIYILVISFTSLLLFLLFFIALVYYVTMANSGKFNSLAPERSGCDYKNVISNLVLLIGIFRSPHDNALWWMPQDLTDNKSTLVQVMVWCCQAESHYLSQCWPRSLLPNGITRPQWVKHTLSLNQPTTHFWCHKYSPMLQLNLPS